MLKIASDLNSKKISKATRGKLFYFFGEEKRTNLYKTLSERCEIKDLKCWQRYVPTGARLQHGIF